MNVLIHKSITGRTAVEIARSLERAVRVGRLRPGARLPTVRALARHLGTSPATVASAYRSLGRRGLVLAAGRRGTRVAGAPPLRTRIDAPVPEGVRDLASGNPDAALLPPLGPALRRIDPAHHLYGQPNPVPELATLVARELAADGIPAGPLAVVSGALDGIERVLEAQLRPGDRIAVEDPGFTSVLDLCAARGLVPLPVELDDEGPLPESLADALDGGAEAFVWTPRAQNPTGAALSAGRAKALRALLREHPGALVIEDDHAGGVAGAPARTLCDARRERWAVVRSVAKALGPDLRLGFLCGDPETLGRVEGRQRMGLRWVSFLLQRTVLALLTDPGARRAVRHAARTYSGRREALLRALASRGVRACGRSGMNVWVPVPEEGTVAQRLLAQGFAVTPGERFRIRSAPGIRITTATLRPAEAERLADAVASTLNSGGSAEVA
jgi:DNA-binding transcriptional MocR family regulator